jgi:hypothetical protein
MPRIRTIGTNPVQVAADNPDRRAYNLLMPATSVESGNTGRIHIGLGFIPSTVVGSPVQGHILTQGDQLRDEMLFADDYSVWRGSIWAVASVADQRLWVDEALRSDPAGLARPSETAAAAGEAARG